MIIDNRNYKYTYCDIYCGDTTWKEKGLYFCLFQLQAKCAQYASLTPGYNVDEMKFMREANEKLVWGWCTGDYCNYWQNDVKPTNSCETINAYRTFYEGIAKGSNREDQLKAEQALKGMYSPPGGK